MFVARRQEKARAQGEDPVMQELVRLSDKIESLEIELTRSPLSSRTGDDGAAPVKESGKHGSSDPAAGPISEGG
jgi:hypothetical protein